MKDFDFNSELDAILAEFQTESTGKDKNTDIFIEDEAAKAAEEAAAAERKAAEERRVAAERRATEERQAAAQRAEERRVVAERQAAERKAAEECRAAEQARIEAAESRRRAADEEMELRRADEELERRRAVLEARRRAAQEEDEDDEYDEDDYEDEDEYDDDEDEIYRPKRQHGFKRFLVGILGTVFALLSLILLVWTGVHVHPDAQTASASKSDNRTNSVIKLDTYSNNAKADALGELASYRKKYTIDEGALFAPRPNMNCYGEVPVSNPSEVLNVIQKARDSGLLGKDEQVVFDPTVEFYSDGSNIRYYYDETILVILWKEMINGRICSNAEIKIADASQFRRKLADDSYQTAVQYNCSQMANQANAVVAMNADFFAFRDYGITVYQRQVYRVNPNMTDTCYITASGDMIYSLRGELLTQEEAQKFVDDNNVLYSLAFGPILIYDGVVQYCDTYPMGEIDQEYSRAGIGQVDNLHYLYMTVNHAVEGGVPRCNVNEFAEIFATQNVKTAYNLDGGQTSEINIQGEMYNRVDWGNERPVSDIIYFATALDEEVG